jgi:hypothetical protein
MVWIRSRAELLRLACNQHKLLAECGQTTRKPKIGPVRESRILRASGQRVKQKSGDDSANGESLQLKRLLQRQMIEKKVMVPEIPRRSIQAVKYSDPSQLTNQRVIK